MTMSIAPRTHGIEAAPSSALGPIPFPRLVRVEWAKATDTRAARWLLALVALSTAGMMLAPILAPTSFDQTYTSYLGVAALALAILLPVVAILMLTGEWSQRSAFTTFTQEPRRIRVVNAKLAASLILGGGAAVFGGVVTAAGLGLASASGRGPGGEPDRRRHHRLSALRAPQCPRRRRARGAAAELGDGHRRLLRPPRRVRAARHRIDAGR